MKKISTLIIVIGISCLSFAQNKYNHGSSYTSYINND
jgi:hypothetical protein